MTSQLFVSLLSTRCAEAEAKVEVLLERAQIAERKLAALQAAAVKPFTRPVRWYARENASLSPATQQAIDRGTIGELHASATITDEEWELYHGTETGQQEAVEEMLLREARKLISTDTRYDPRRRVRVTSGRLVLGELLRPDTPKPEGKP